MSDFLHYIFPGMSETKERKLAREILAEIPFFGGYVTSHGEQVWNADIQNLMDMAQKGGEGSGNFGHAGRPGEVGGSAGDSNNNSVIATVNDGYRKVDIYKIEDTANIGKEFSSIAVCIRGKDNGLVIASKIQSAHSALVSGVNGNLDDYVRFTAGYRKGETYLEGYTKYAGVIITDKESEISALNNIYKAADKLTSNGLSNDTKLLIWTDNNNYIETTAKEFIEEYS